MTTFVVNPGNVNPLSQSVSYKDMFFDFEIAKRVPLMIYCLIALWLILLGVATILVTKKKQEPKHEAYMVNMEIELSNKDSKLSKANSVMVITNDKNLANFVAADPMDVEGEN